MAISLIVLMLILSVAAQVFGVYLLPMTQGLTQLVPTIGAGLSILFAVGLMARITHAGVNLSTLMPIIAATVPLGAIAVGILMYVMTQ